MRLGWSRGELDNSFEWVYLLCSSLHRLTKRWFKLCTHKRFFFLLLIRHHRHCRAGDSWWIFFLFIYRSKKLGSTYGSSQWNWGDNRAIRGTERLLIKLSITRVRETGRCGDEAMHEPIITGSCFSFLLSYPQNHSAPLLLWNVMNREVISTWRWRQTRRSTAE